VPVITLRLLAAALLTVSLTVSQPALLLLFALGIELIVRGKLYGTDDPRTVVNPFLFGILIVTPVAIHSGEMPQRLRFGAEFSEEYWLSLGLIAVFFVISQRRFRTSESLAISGPSRPSLHFLGATAIVAASAYRLGVLLLIGPLTFNKAHAFPQLEVLSGSLLGAGLILIGLSDVENKWGGKIRILLVVSALLHLSAGSNSELSAFFLIPIVFGTRKREQSVPLRRIIIGSVLAVCVATAVLNIRSNNPARRLPESDFVTNIALDPTKSAAYVWAEGIHALDGQRLNGTTFVQPIPYIFIPSPIASELIGDDIGSGSLELPVLLGYTGTSGLGFSLGFEPHLNFGHIGDVVGGLSFGALVSFSHRAFRRRRSLVGASVYPHLVGWLPLILRSDAYQLANGLFYSVAIVWLAGQLAARQTVDSSRSAKESTSLSNTLRR